MTAFLNDALTEGSTINLTAHTPGTGGAWSKHPSFSADLEVIGGAGYARGATASSALYLNAATPPTADYYVEAPIDREASNDVFAGVLGRMDTSANTLYQLYYQNTVGQWELGQNVAGVATTLGTYTATLTSGTPVTARLEMIGTTIKAYLDGVERISGTGSITAAGKAGLRARNGGRVLSVTAEEIGALLSSATTNVTGSTTTTVGCTTTRSDGTLYVVVTTSATQPSVAQIIAGQDHTGAAAVFAANQTITSSGAKTVGATGLAQTTAYYGHFVHRDPTSHDSNRLSTSEFTTLATPAAPTIGTTTSITSSGATINWTDNSSNETGFQVQIETPSGAGNWTNANTSPAAANATSLAISGLSGSTEYRPRVAATDVGGLSSYSTGTAFTTAAGGGSTLLPKLMQLLN
jgi:hypothetical protein